MSRTISSFLALVIVLCSGAAVAQRPGMPKADGPRSRAGVKKEVVALFDRNRDGRLDRKEWRKARNTLREIRPGRRQGGERPRARGGTLRFRGERARPGEERPDRRGDRARVGPPRDRAGVGPRGERARRGLDGPRSDGETRPSPRRARVRVPEVAEPATRPRINR
jgi:hypothetical protein